MITTIYVLSRNKETINTFQVEKAPYMTCHPGDSNDYPQHFCEQIRKLSMCFD